MLFPAALLQRWLRKGKSADRASKSVLLRTEKTSAVGHGMAVAAFLDRHARTSLKAVASLAGPSLD